jgi:glycosyltransferase involved in cell wall biosynthesis
MRSAQSPGARVSAVIAAYNEGRTIAAVVAALEQHSLIGEIIVVSDGSTDDTVERARATSARVIVQPVNRGKAAALERGIAAARHEHLLLCDADIHGLTPEIITRMVSPVLSGECAMFVGLCDRRVYWLNRLLHFFPIIGGERALTRDLWNRVPAEYKKKFQVEIAMNFFAKRLGEHMAFGVMPGLGQVIKERKRGLWRGLGQRLSMCADIVIIAVRLYAIFPLATALAYVRPARPVDPVALVSRVVDRTPQ